MTIDKRCSFVAFFSNETVINRMVIYLMKFSFKSLECEKFKTEIYAVTQFADWSNFNKSD